MTQCKITPFRIQVPEQQLQRLQSKLALTDWPAELDSDIQLPWERGPPVAEVRRLVEYWRNEYDWRRAETALNDALPQYKTLIQVDGLGTYDIHFVHLKSKSKNAIPLLFLHGWPGSFYEVSKIAPLLAQASDGSQPSFHVIAPSLVDHGFSSSSRTKEFHIDQHAEVVHKLMLALGYDRYVAQGGDTGYLICRMLAQLYPSYCLAHHINFAVPSAPTRERDPEIYDQWQKQGRFLGLSEAEQEGIERARQFQKEGSGYFAIHSTRPMALGFAMADSPVGLLSWILDKLHLWTDDYAWTPDEILTWISIYYFSTAGPAASFNTYYSNQHRKPLNSFEQAARRTDTPLGISRFRKEISNLPKLWNQTLGNVVFEAEHDRGGHFAAFEVPELLVGDLRKMFHREGPLHRVVRETKI